MKSSLQLTFLVVLASVSSSYQLYASDKSSSEQTTQAAIVHVEEEVALLNTIANKVSIIADTSDDHARKQAVKKLRKHMNGLDKNIHKELTQGCNQLINATDEATRKNISSTLLAKIDAINARANVVKTAHDGTIAINAVSDELKPTVIQEQNRKFIEAEKIAAEKSFLSNLKTRVFGDEVSWVKAGLYAAVGAAIVAIMSYGGYKYYLYTKEQSELKNMWDKIFAENERKFPILHAEEINARYKQRIQQHKYETAEQIYNNNPTQKNYDEYRNQLHILVEEDQKARTACFHLSNEEDKKARTIAEQRFQEQLFKQLAQ